MGKKGFLLLLVLFVLAAAACATSSSTPSSTASRSPKAEQPTSTAATGTPEDLYQSLIGEWRGWFTYGVIGSLTIYEIDIAKAKARCRWTTKVAEWGSPPVVDNTFVADFIPGPNPKVKWKIESGRYQREFVLKNNLLEGSLIVQGMFGQPRIVTDIQMEKYNKKSGSELGTK